MNNLFERLPQCLINYIYSFNNQDDHSKKYQDTLKIIKKCEQFDLGWTYNYPLIKQNYVCLWKHDNCVEQKHQIKLYRSRNKPFGVIGNCLTCKKFQGFKWKEMNLNNFLVDIKKK